ncbi:MAG: DUF4491 family protein [Prevotellaceae bacterium]|nr:DUF4491 family protein [Prevotellaceae bacterium]
MEFLSTYNLTGLAIGIATFLIIGLFHPIVIKAEYHWGTKSWWLFLLVGIVFVILSLAVRNILWSTVMGVVAFSSFWTILEIFQQQKRVEKGWFPENPKRKKIKRNYRHCEEERRSNPEKK